MLVSEARLAQARGTILRVAVHGVHDEHVADRRPLVLVAADLRHLRAQDGGRARLTEPEGHNII